MFATEPAAAGLASVHCRHHRVISLQDKTVMNEMGIFFSQTISCDFKKTPRISYRAGGHRRRDIAGPWGAGRNRRVRYRRRPQISGVAGDDLEEVFGSAVVVTRSGPYFTELLLRGLRGWQMEQTHQSRAGARFEGHRQASRLSALRFGDSH